MKLKDRKRFEFTDVLVRAYPKCLVILWSAKGIGFGEMQFRTEQGSGPGDHNLIKVETECMPDNFVKALLRVVMKKLQEAERID